MQYTAISRIPRRSKQEFPPLSFAQQRLLFIDQLTPGSAAYNIPAALRLRGALAVEALEQTLSEIVRRHESLRTSFVMLEGDPAQVIAEAKPMRMAMEDLQALVPAQREEVARRLAREEARRAFDLSRGPLLRVGLLRLGEDDHVAFFTTHHIISDGWSMGVLIREVSALYQAYSQGVCSPLEEPELQYADYALWQREWLRGEELERQLEYWRRQLVGGPALELPTDYPRPAVQSFRGAAEGVALAPRLMQGLKELSWQENATPFMILLAAFQVLLMRYSGQNEIVVGSPIAGRNRAETEGVIGFFVNTLALRTDLSGDPSFRDLVKRIREVTLGAYRHQDMPFEKLVKELQPERDLSRQPLTQVFLNMQNNPDYLIRLHGLSVDSFSAFDVLSKFDLTLDFNDQGNNAYVIFIYNTDLFDQARIIEMLEQFRYLFEQIVSAPQRSINSYSLVTTRSRHLLPDPRESLSEPHYEPVLETFLSLASQAPRERAVCQGDQVWTYGKLSERARGLAQILLTEGLKPGEIVGVIGLPSFGLITSLMSVLLSGGVLLTIDRNLPISRQRLMLSQAEAKHILFVDESGRQDELIEELKVNLLLHVSQREGTVINYIPSSQKNIDWPKISPSDPAYIFFTSGTTGVPKGVLGCHKGLSHFLTWQRETFGVGPQDKCAQLTSLSFDAVLRDIFLPLTSGASLHLLEESDASNGDQIIRWMNRERITLLHIVPSLAQSWLINLLPETSQNTLRWTFFAGEPLTDALVRRWRKIFHKTEVINLYGPTETTLVKCYYVVPSNPPPGVQLIGRPLPNTQALILRENGALCGIGESGEIVLRTPFRTLGYLCATAEDRKRFVRNHFRDGEDDILYHTGDIGRYHLEGSLEILGRLDDQVKIRGVRIEPSEVAAVLLCHSNVKACAVLSHRDAHSQNYLVAYVVLGHKSRGVISELRLHISRYLPSTMVPSLFVVMEKLPLTSSGKIDRKALLALGTPHPECERDYLAPHSPTEEMIAGIWAEVLGADQVGVLDNFFELGGHSLLATQVVSRVREAFLAELPLRNLFESPTVRGLARRLEELVKAGEGAPPPPIRRAARVDRLPLSFAQQRLWFLDQLTPGSAVYNISIALRLRGALEVGALEQTLGEIIRRHESLRTRFMVTDGEPTQLIAEAMPMRLAVWDLQSLTPERREEEARRLSRAEAARPFDLSRGPLLRARLLRLSEQEHVALFTTHHIISDGWSMGVLVKEVATFYDSFSQGQGSPLGEAELQYVDYALWQREWLRGEELERQLEYWRRQLAEAPILELPIDYRRPAMQSQRGRRISFRLGGEHTRKLKELSRRENATPFMVLLAAFQMLLMRYSGQDDLVVGSPIANRNRAETEGMIGFFVNTLALRTDLSGDPSFRELVKRVREVTLGAYMRQDVPFERLVEELQPERDLSRQPLFQVMFVFQNAPQEELELPGLTLGGFEVEDEAAKFDLTLTVGEMSESLGMVWNYSRDLYEEQTILRMSRHFQNILEGMVADPQMSVSDLEMLTQAEREQILVEWNQTRRDYPRELRLHELFERQALLSPEAVAVVSEGQRLSYGELNLRSNQLASYLRGLGVGPEVVVGLCLERSLEMVIGLLGVLKAGGAYLPLDPDYPIERLAWMIQDAETPVLLAQRKLLNRLPETMARVICIEEAWERIWQSGKERVADGVQGANAAYLIYTSGSTGRPKGALNTHAGITNRILWMQEIYGLTEQDRVLQKTPFSFDVSVWEFLWPLITGARLVMARPGGHRDAGYLSEVIEQEAITTLHFVPSMLAAFLEEPNRGQSWGLRRVVSSGETLPVEVAERLFEHKPGVELHNLYGPTEAAVDVTYWACEKGYAGATIPIGKPIANTRIFVLNERLEPMPIGAPAELYIGGEGLARGYLKRPDLTAEKFVPRPFGDEPGERLYRTGDLARHLGDGNLGFLGRIDEQVKIRGYRIEPGEVEAALREHPEVSEAVVVARQDQAQEKRLVAYLVVCDGVSPGHGELRGFLKERLPDYMTPSAFVMIEQLPLTPSGKIDRKALPAPGARRPELGQDYIAPQTQVEQTLTEIWSQVLGEKQISVTDNFFNLGGHSLSATNLLLRIQRTIGIDLSLKDFFMSPTIRDLAKIVEEAILTESDPAKIDEILDLIEGVDENEL